MSIRRIIDLPILSAQTVESGRFLSSFIELSYLSVDSEERSTGRYESKAMTCGDFIRTIPQPDEFFGRKYFPNGVNISTDLQLQGDLYVNADSSIYSKYHADLKFGNIDFKATQDIGLSSDANVIIKGGPGKIKIGSLDASRGVIELSNTARVNTTISSDPSSIVNMAELSVQLEAWKAKILAEIGGGGGGQEIKYRINLPLLSFVYLDHELADTETEWKKAGSQVELTAYTKLYDYISDNKDKIRWQNKSSGKENDTWFYKLENEILTLPKTNWFVQGETGNVIQFKEAGLPAHTHGVRICGKDGMSAWHGRRGNDTSGEDATMSSYGASDPIYGKSATVQPNATTMFIYFYVGPKD